MMSTTDVFLYAALQGLTEFLPVSSSAHLIFFSLFLGKTPPGPFMEVAVHLGTLGAVLLYFWRDVLALIRGGMHALSLRPTAERTFFFQLVLATLPVVVLGFFVDRLGARGHQGVLILGLSTMGFGILLYVADRWGRKVYTLGNMTYLEAFLGWGVAQSFALIAGASRSGVCLTMGRALGYTREAAAKFAFLMSIPAITAAVTLKGIHFWSEGDFTLLGPMALGAVMAFVFGLLTIRFMMVWLHRCSLTPFVVYRLILGAVLLLIAFL